MTREANEVAKAIRLAFPVDPIPAFEALFTDAVAPGEEIYDDLELHVLGKGWDQIGFGTFDQVAGASVLRIGMAPDAFRYYLPAILMCALDEREWINDGLLSLMPQNKAHVPRGEWWARYVQGFTPAQVDAVKKFLRYAASMSDSGSENSFLACQALETTWSE